MSGDDRSEAARKRRNVRPNQSLAIILNTICVPGHHLGRHSSCTHTNLPFTSLHPPPASHQLITTTRHRHHWQRCLNLVRSSLLPHTGQPVFAVTRKPTSTRLARCRKRRLVLLSNISTSHPSQLLSSSCLLLFLVAPVLPLPPNSRTSFNSDPDQSYNHRSPPPYHDGSRPHHGVFEGEEQHSCSAKHRKWLARADRPGERPAWTQHLIFTHSGKLTHPSTQSRLPKRPPANRRNCLLPEMH
jgi:hypothetical protein